MSNLPVKLIIEMGAAMSAEVMNAESNTGDPLQIATSTFFYGFQIALELAMIDHNQALRAIRAIHEAQAADNPETRLEWNKAAATFAHALKKGR